MSRAPNLVVLAAVLVACAQPEPPPTAQPDPALAVAPSVTDGEAAPLVRPAPPVPDASPSVPPGSGDDAPTSDASTPDPDPSPSRPAASGGDTAPTEPVVLLSVGDPAGDHGPEGPAWTDLTAVELTELGNDLQVTLQFAGALPSTPAEGEVPLIGVDIGTGDDGYQLFVEGGGQSWAAYLQTPQGFVEYPGTFRLGGRSIVLQVPFSAVGSPTRAPVTVFVEWSRERLVLNAASEDRLDGGPHTFDRNP